MENLLETEINKINRIKKLMETTITTELLRMPTAILPYLDGAIVSGGATASFYHGEQPNDYDIYLRDSLTATTFSLMVQNNEELKEFVKEINDKYYDDTIIPGLLITTRAVTFKNGLQVITFLTRDDRHTFDYIHCMPYLDLHTRKFHISENQLRSIKHKKLVKNKFSAKTPSLRRTQKFIDRGWTLE